MDRREPAAEFSDRLRPALVRGSDRRCGQAGRAVEAEFGGRGSRLQRHVECEPTVGSSRRPKRRAWKRLVARKLERLKGGRRKHVRGSVELEPDAVAAE